MYLSSKTWYLAAVEETETFDELFVSLVGLLFFPWPPVGLFSLGLWPRLNNWPPFGLGKKSPTSEKKSSSLVSFLYRPNNVLETEHVFYFFWTEFFPKNANCRLSIFNEFPKILNSLVSILHFFSSMRYWFLININLWSFPIFFMIS